MNQQDERGTGKTTGLMLMTIAKAVLHRGEMVEFINHCCNNYADALRHKAIMQSMCDELGLDRMVIKNIRNKVFVIRQFATESEAE